MKLWVITIDYDLQPPTVVYTQSTMSPCPGPAGPGVITSDQVTQWSLFPSSNFLPAFPIQPAKPNNHQLTFLDMNFNSPIWQYTCQYSLFPPLLCFYNSFTIIILLYSPLDYWANLHRNPLEYHPPLSIQCWYIHHFYSNLCWSLT